MFGFEGVVLGIREWFFSVFLLSRQRFSILLGQRITSLTSAVDKEGGMAVHDIPRLANWVAAHSISGPEEKRLASRDEKRTIPSSTQKHIITP